MIALVLLANKLGLFSNLVQLPLLRVKAPFVENSSQKALVLL